SPNSRDEFAGGRVGSIHIWGFVSSTVLILAGPCSALSGSAHLLASSAQSRSQQRIVSSLALSGLSVATLRSVPCRRALSMGLGSYAKLLDLGSQDSYRHLDNRWRHLFRRCLSRCFPLHPRTATRDR